MKPVPLKLALEPGDHRCEWILEDAYNAQETYTSHGDLKIAGSQQPYGNVFGRAPLKWELDADGTRHTHTPQTYEHSVVRGDLENGMNVLLIDVILTVFDDGEQRSSVRRNSSNAYLDAAIAIVGRGHPSTENLRFDSAKIQITGLDELAALAPIASTSFPSRLKEPGEKTWSATYQPESNQVWENEDVRISISYEGTAKIADGYDFQLSFSPSVEIVLTEAVPFNVFYTEWIHPLKAIVSAASGGQEDITYLACSPIFQDDRREPHERMFQVYMAAVTQEPFKSETDFKRQRKFAIQLARDDLSLLDLLEAWRKQSLAGNPILENYDPFALSDEQHPRARFLLLIQSLEGLCGHENRLAHLIPPFLEKRQKMLDVIAPGLSKTQLRFFTKNLRDNPLNLDLVLTEMFSALPVDVTSEFDESDLIKSLQAETTSGSAVECLRFIRNELAHGKRSFNPYELQELTTILHRVVRAHVLRILGALDGNLRAVLESGVS